MSHVILLTAGTGGDIYPFMRIGEAMRQEGFKVTLFTHCVYQEQATKAGFHFIPIDTYEEYQSTIQSSEVHARLQTPREGIAFFREFMFPKVSTSFHRIIQVLHEPDTVLIGHFMLHGLNQMLYERTAVPYLTVFLAPSFLDNGGTDKDSYAYISNEMNGIRKELGFKPIANWKQMVECYTHGLAFWPGWFTKPESLRPTSITQVGFLLHENQENLQPEVLSWLKNQPPPIMITHGTSTPFNDSFFISCIEACRYLGYPAMVVTKHPQYLPKQLPPNMLHVPFLAFSKVVEYLAVLVHHGGIGTTGQAFLSGVPQLILGKGFDRPRNASFVAMLGAGEFLPVVKWTMPEVAGVLSRLIRDSAVKQRCTDISKWFQDADPVGEIKRTVKSVLNHPVTPDFSLLYETDIYTKAIVDEEKLNLVKGLSANQRRALLARLKIPNQG